jgi:hypothetical protein
MMILLAFGACTNEQDGTSAATPEKAVVEPDSDATAAPQPAFAMNADAEVVPQSGWQADPPTRQVLKKQGATEKELPPLTAVEQARYDRVARTLVESLNAHDKKTYRSLFTDEAWGNAIDWYREMFATQLMSFGKIERAYAPRRGIVRVGKMGIGGDARGGASFVAIFEDQVGGVFSIELNDKDQIVHSSVFIKQELAAFDGWEAKPIYELPD